MIGDSHSKPGVSNARYGWLGNLIADVGADVVVDIGDWWDMESLSSYDKGKKSFEGRRYKKDIEAGVEAQERLSLKLVRHGIAPRLIRTEGNHEARIAKVGQLNPELDGLISNKDLESEEYGWEFYPFLTPVEVNGIVYCHYFTSGIMGRPISGEHPAYSLLQRKSQSCVSGHSHILDYCTRNDALGNRRSAVVAGCYFAHEEKWAGPQVNKIWDRGIVVLREVKDGEFDFQWINIKAIEKKYKD